MKKKIYIAGPMTGLPDLNFPAFHGEASWLRAMGNEVINPAEINDEGLAVMAFTAEEYQEHWRKCMRADIAQLVTCDAIHMLDGWEKSCGATLEHHIARTLGMAITFSPRATAEVRHGR
jgi:hypothetical protein